MSNGKNRTKQLKARGRALRIKERRLARQAGMISGAKNVLREAYDEGHRMGVIAGLSMAEDLTHEHRRMRDYVTDLQRLVLKKRTGG